VTCLGSTLEEAFATALAIRKTLGISGDGVDSTAA
jgi:hypothetical protein